MCCLFLNSKKREYKEGPWSLDCEKSEAKICKSEGRHGATRQAHLADPSGTLERPTWLPLDS